MKTRNQLIGRVSSETTNNATIQQDSGTPNASPSTRSTPPPRLRDRRPSSSEPKSLLPTFVATSGKSPSPPAGAKRSLTGPTRILPRRSCGRPVSLLAATQPQTSVMESSLKKVVSVKRNTPDPELDIQLSSESNSQALETTEANFAVKSERLDTIITAAINKNHSNDNLLTKDASISKPAKHDNNITTRNNKAKLVCISLPDNNNSSTSTGTTNLDLAGASIQDKNRYMVTINGLRKIGCSDTEASIADNTVPDEGVDQSTNSIQQTAGHEETNAPITNMSSPAKTFNVLICVTGSVATIKLVELANKIKSMFPRPYSVRTSGIIEALVKIKIVMTHNSKHFAPKEELVKQLNDSDIEIYDDADEWSQWKKMNDPVLHIELRKWADLCLIAPLDANTMAKLANGICDNLLTCLVRAWDISKPLIYCPAMNVHMYNHPLTREQLCKLQSFGYLRVDCVEKRLACGDIGIGGMASVESITNKVVDSLTQPVTKKVSLSRPLLNQQPTYPIISTSEDHDESTQTNSRLSNSISDQILNRFRTNTQITVHAVPNPRLNQSSSCGLDSDPTLNFRKRRKPNSIEYEDYFLGNEKIADKSNAIQNLQGNRNGQHKIGGVTSVQNLRAIGMEGTSLELCTGPTTYNGTDDGVGFELDPTKLLEQTMTTDEPHSVNNDLRDSAFYNSTSYGVARNSSFGLDGAGKVANLTPLFNTSKFLALCHNKERNCFTCTICKHDYKNRKSMARHLKEQHVQGSIYQCKPCGVSYKRREKLIKHNRERHPQVLNL